MAQPLVRVLMVGPSLALPGGIAAVLGSWREQGLFERCAVIYVATVEGGAAWRRLGQAGRAWWRCALLIATGRCQLVHVHTSSGASFWRKSPVLAMALLSGRPLVVSLHGGRFRSFHAACPAPGRAWIEFVMRRAACFVVLTESWRAWALAVQPTARVQVIPNTTRLPGEASVAEVESDLLLFLGRIERDKGIYTLIEALALARRQGARWRLVCGGLGEIEAAQAHAGRCGLPSDALRFEGWLEGGAKAVWLRRCSLLVLPSFVENMPVAVIEAFAFGKPVIASRVGGVPDMLQPGQQGWLVEPGDVAGLARALCEADADTDGVARMGRQAHATAMHCYQPDHIVAQVEALYRTCSS